MFGLQWQDFLVIVAYLVIVTIIGVWMGKRVHNMGDFAMPRTFGKILMIFFSFGTGTNSDQAVAVAAKSYTNGISGIWYSWLGIFTTPFFWIIAPIFRRLRAVTTADVFEARFGRSMACLYAFLGFTKLMFSIGLSLKGGAIMLTAVSGGAISGDVSIFVLTVLFVLYGTVGGLSAAVMTDLIQGLMTIAFSFMLLPLILNSIGGLEGIRSSIDNPEFFNLLSNEQIGLFFVTMLGILGLLMVIGAPHTMGNCAAGRNEMDGAVGFMVGSFVKRICTVAWAFVGLAGVVYFAGREINPEEVYGQVAREFLPRIGWGLLGFFLASMMAAMMSTCDALMVAASALFTQNLYKPLRPHRSAKHYLAVVRISGVVIVTGAVSIAYLLPGFIAGVEIYWKLSSIIGLALLMGLIWRGLTPAGAWATTLGAYGTWLLLYYSPAVALIARCPMVTEWGIIRQNASGVASVYMPWQILFFLIAGITSGIVVSRFTRQIPHEKLDRFYALIRTPIQPGEVVEESCVLPRGVNPPTPRHIFPGTSIELLIPSSRTVAGFAAGCAGVVALIGAVVWILS
ncbi:sodium:solute symporter family protein [Opitutaceae bacterium TAV4]|nr:sodium:solute symporter family protein [Opitutaceae bacterium TAV4]RRK02685.1 sodium:solute symporter family protein [Opitutaceae bacterium TAV3]